MILRVAAALLAGMILPLGVAAQEKPATRPAKGAAAGSIPIEHFASLPFLTAPELSPDGTRIAARIAVAGQLRLAIVPLGDVKKMISIGMGENDLNDWEWVNNDWLIANIGATEKVQGDDWYLSRTASISADGNKVIMLGAKMAAQNAGNVLWMAHDGSPHILLAMQTSVYSNDEGFWPEVRDFDVSTGKSTRVVSSTDKVSSWFADGTGTVRMGVAYNDDRRSYRLLYRDDRTKSFRTVSKARGRGASLGSVPAMFLAEPGPGSNRALAFDDSDGFNALYAFDLTTLKTGEKMFGKPGYDIGGIIPDATGTRIIGVQYTDTHSRTHWFDPVLAGIQADIDKAVGARHAQITSWSSDFSVLIVKVAGADRPGAYYVYRPDDGRLRVLAKINEALGTDAQSPVSTIKYKARDGLEISAILTVPKGKAAKDLPLILMPHGGPAVRDDESWNWQAQFLASRGYAVLQPNYRGSTGFGTAFTEKGQGQWGLAMQDDLIDAVKWAASTGLADAKRVCIVGGSYGGYAAFRAAQRDTGIYRCAVSFAGVSDMPAMQRYDRGFLNGGRTNDYFQGFAPDLKSVSPINYAAQFSTPILIIHGKLDRVVQVRQSREMAEKLKAAGKPYRYVEQPLGDHHFSRQADRVQFLTELEAFLKEHNPA
ncbi:S9 family peptidase [Sphingomonas sp. So64.6b]|uniref:alpha/beta hydrolase family protein n=1 Tax=Sphingomonas sp. So64.6b TaxID=2997354 RepID=UPI001603505E|nr:S9 family peptidase [Sphingomonas sp. So64.6b]QNA86246.1 S9 family peptidase [Sphingomonas sp. So64.6b]